MFLEQNKSTKRYRFYWPPPPPQPQSQHTNHNTIKYTIDSTLNKVVWTIKAKGFHSFNTFKENSVQCIIHMIVSNSLKHNFVVQRRMYDLKYWTKLCYLKKCFGCEFDTVDCNNHHIYIWWKTLSNVNMVFLCSNRVDFFLLPTSTLWGTYQLTYI